MILNTERNPEIYRISELAYKIADAKAWVHLHSIPIRRTAGTGYGGGGSAVRAVDAGGAGEGVLRGNCEKKFQD